MQKSVLIVEDDYLIAMDLKFMLEELGWRVLGPAATVNKALALLLEEPPVVALLDVSLGDEVVTPVAQALKEQAIPFAVASAYTKPEQYGGAILAEVPNIGKPVSQRRLLAVLTELLTVGGSRATT